MSGLVVDAYDDMEETEYLLKNATNNKRSQEPVKECAKQDPTSLVFDFCTQNQQS